MKLSKDLGKNPMFLPLEVEFSPSHTGGDFLLGNHCVNSFGQFLFQF